MIHFGVRLIKRRYSFHLNRDEYALIDTKPSLPKFESLVQENAYVDSTSIEYSTEWCEEYRKLCLKNYDLNLQYFCRLNREHFNNALDLFLERNNRFVEVFDLNEYDGAEGYYIMVLDQYKQVYIGKSVDIKKRIQQHWTKTIKFDRVLFPMYAVSSSCLSIDAFRALDTTRIFVWKTKIKYGIEEMLINGFPQEYRTNRIGGDILLGGDLSEMLKAITSINKREL